MFTARLTLVVCAVLALALASAADHVVSDFEQTATDAKIFKCADKHLMITVNGGVAELHQFNGSTWDSLGNFNPTTATSGTFGSYCDIDAVNGRAVISDPTNKLAYVFSTVTFNELFTVNQVQAAASVGGVSIQGNRLAVGEVRVSHSGRVSRYTVDYTTNTVSAPLTFVVSSDERYGNSIKICGDVVAVGATLEGPDNQGRVFALDFDTNTNTLLAEHPDNVYATNDYMGRRVDCSADGSRIIGTSKREGTLEASMVIWERNMGGTYVPVARLGTPGTSVGTYGAMHDNGDVVCLGQYLTTVDSLVEAGQVSIWSWDGSDWVGPTVVTAPTPAANDDFGYDCGFAGTNTMVVAAGGSGNYHSFQYTLTNTENVPCAQGSLESSQDLSVVPTFAVTTTNCDDGFLCGTITLANGGGVDGASTALASSAGTSVTLTPSCAVDVNTYTFALDLADIAALAGESAGDIVHDIDTTADTRHSFDPTVVTAFSRYTFVVDTTFTTSFVEPRTNTQIDTTQTSPNVVIVNVPTAFAVDESDFFAFDVADTDIYVTLQDATITSVSSINGAGGATDDTASAAVVIEFSTLVQLPYRVDETSFAYTGAETVVSVSEDCDATNLVDGTDTTAFCTQSWSLTVTNAADTSVCSFAGDYVFSFQITCEGSAISGQDNCPLGANDPTTASTLTVTLADADACAAFAVVDAATTIAVETREAPGCTTDRDSFVDTEDVCFWAQATSDLPIASVEITQVSDGTTTGNDNSGSSAGNTDTNVIAISVFGSSAADSWFTTTFTYTVEVSYVGGARRRAMLQVAGAESLTASKTVAILPAGAAAGDAAATTNNVAAAGSASSTATIALLAGVGVAVVAAGAGVAIAVKSRREVAAVPVAKIAAPAVVVADKANQQAASPSSSSSSSFVELSSSELIEFSSASA